MNVLFVHQNLPGQYKHLAPALAADTRNRVAFITLEGKPSLPGIARATYRLAREVAPGTHSYLRRLESQILYGQGVVRAGVELRRQGFEPDVICAHPGWGEALFLRDLYPDARILVYCEFFYSSRGSDVDFPADFKPDLNQDCRMRLRNANLLTSIHAADAGISPTRWQRDAHPDWLHPMISVIHDGIDTEQCRPDPAAVLTLPNGRRLTPADEVITYIARNLEPYRGYEVFIRALGPIFRRRPKAHVVILGGDEVSYGAKPAADETWREHALIGADIDPARIHFLGRVPYTQFQAVLRVSTVHVYLSYPFVLSWSMLEAMSHSCLVIGSATPPVQEVLEHGRNGLLFDFYDREALIRRVLTALENREAMAPLRRAARETVLRDYDLRRRCLPAQMALVERLAAARPGGARSAGLAAR